MGDRRTLVVGSYKSEQGRYSCREYVSSAPTPHSPNPYEQNYTQGAMFVYDMFVYDIAESKLSGVSHQQGQIHCHAQ